MKKLQALLIVSLLIVSITFAGCEKLKLSSDPEITISPMGNRILSEIAIREVDKVEDGQIHFTGGNYANEKTEIMDATTYEVKPGKYYVYFRYKNMNSLVGGFWQTTSANLIDIKENESYTIKYGYNGGTIVKD